MPVPLLSTLSRPVTPQAILPDAIPELTPDHPWHYRLWPTEWKLLQVGKEWHILPHLARRVWTPGCDVRTPRDGQKPGEHYRDAMQREMDRGFVFLDPLADIPAQFLPDGCTPGGYLRTLDVRAPVSRGGLSGTRHVSPWDDLVAPLDSDGEWEVRMSDPAKIEMHRRWLIYLVETGVLPEPDKRVVDAIIAEKESRLLKFRAQPQADAGVKESGIASREATLAAARKAKVPRRIAKGAA